MGFELPEEALIEQEYIGKTPEEIYPMLVKKQNQKKEEKKDGGQTNNESGSVGTDGSAGEKKEGKSDSGRKGDSKGKDESEEPEQNGQGEPEEESGVGNDPGGCGEIRDMKNEDGSAMSEAELSNAEAAVKIMIASAANIAEKAGVGYSEALKKLIGELKAPERNWREDLLEYFQQYAKNDYTWSSPSRRHVPFGLYLPSMRSQEIGQVVLVGDSSGSTTNLWEPFMSEMKSLMEMFNLKLTVIIADNQIQETREEVESEEILTIQPSGFGGTDFRPAFDWVEIMGIEPALLIYFTDLDCRLFPKEPDYPVVWASWKYENAPFGKVIKVK
jgi:predicted metal-dependent peptidase